VRTLRGLLPLLSLMAVAFFVLTGFQAVRAQEALAATGHDLAAFGDRFDNGDLDGARLALAAGREEAQEARQDTRGPGWWLMARVPPLGDDVSAVRTVAAVADDLAGRALPDVIIAARQDRPVAAGVMPLNADLAAFARSGVALAAADVALGRNAALLDRIPRTGLSPQVATAVDDLRHRVAVMRAHVQAALLVARLEAPASPAGGGVRTALAVAR
jgi:hypothetical protein